MTNKEAIEILKRLQDPEPWEPLLNSAAYGALDMAISALEKRDVPAADVVEVKPGYWIDTGSGQECSLCGEIQYGYDSGRHFCPNCGAKMTEV